MVLNACENCGADPEEESREDAQNTRDLKPEFCQYKDEGCEYAASCLDCPYPTCVYDEPRGRLRWRNEERNREIGCYRRAGWQVKDLAALFGLSKRTIRRILERTKVEKTGSVKNA